MSDSKDEPPQSPDVQFEPIVTLAPVEVKTNEENESVLFAERARLYRFDKANDPPEWKERGTGEVKILIGNEDNKKRIVMRRDKTLKVCCNHYVSPDMKLIPSAGSDKAWVWTTSCDFADEVSTPENLAIRFKDSTIACRFKDVFETAEPSTSEKDESKDVADRLEGLSVAESKESANSGDNEKDDNSNEAAKEASTNEPTNEGSSNKTANESQQEAGEEKKSEDDNQSAEASATKEESSSVKAAAATEN